MADNEKQERFKRVASKRVQTVIDTLRLIRNCANRNNYDYTEEDVEKMFTAMDRAMKETRAAYRNTTNAKEDTFTF